MAGEGRRIRSRRTPANWEQRKHPPSDEGRLREIPVNTVSAANTP